jgi:hypothetical protein
MKHGVTTMTNRTPTNLSEALELLNWTTPRSPATLAAWAGNYLDSVTHDCPSRYRIAATIILRECSAR